MKAEMGREGGKKRLNSQMMSPGSALTIFGLKSWSPFPTVTTCTAAIADFPIINADTASCNRDPNMIMTFFFPLLLLLLLKKKIIALLFCRREDKESPFLFLLMEKRKSKSERESKERREVWVGKHITFNAQMGGLPPTLHTHPLLTTKVGAG